MHAPDGNRGTAGAKSGAEDWCERDDDNHENEKGITMTRQMSCGVGILMMFGWVGATMASGAPVARGESLPELTPMVHVRGGTFMMGCTREQQNCDDDEKPVHEVQVDDFEMGRYEVTQALWEAVMGGNPSKVKGCGQCPVDKVSWDDVQMFLLELNDMTGEQYRLPTEAEWEYAARGGQEGKGHQYAGSRIVGKVGWYEGNSGRKTHPVGEKRPNELGVYDMSGNVGEWVQDCYKESYRGAPTDGRAWESGSCSLYSSISEKTIKNVRVLRGGSWDDYPRHLRSAVRVWYTVGDRFDSIGFRLARTLTS